MERLPCRSLRAQRRHSPNNKDKIWRSSMPTRRSTRVLPPKPTCSVSSLSPHRAFIKWCLPWGGADSLAALQDAPAPSKCSSLPRTFQSCDERRIPIDHSLCAEVLAGRMRVERLTAVVVDNASAAHGWPSVAHGWLDGIERRFALENWATATVDGHDHSALAAALSVRSTVRPGVVVARTSPKET